MPTYDRPPLKHLTIAELCRAIEEQRVPARVRAGMYELRSNDVRRLATGAEHPSVRRAPAPRRSAS